jgi:4-methylaminobutanoate oxidase (formaldehyde-forming)
MSEVPATADVIVIGGGVAGLSTAMQLALRGVRVVVLERQRMGCGSTSRAAGLLGQLRGTREHTKLLMDSVEIVKDLQSRVEGEIFVQTGSLRVAETPARAREVSDLVGLGQSIGFAVEVVPPREVARLVPYMRTDDLVAACYCPTDGHVQPAELVSAYLKIGRSHGATYHAPCPVERLIIARGRVQGVQTAAGACHAPAVVNAGGPWSSLIADLAEAILPTAAIGHCYLTTRPDPKYPVDRHSPAVRDRHHRIYSRPESGGLIVGMYEAEPEAYDMQELPADFDMTAMKEARDSLHVATLIAAAQQRFPWISERTAMSITSGIMTFSPDGHPFCGRFPALDGLYHCAGFSGHGIVQSPVIGRIMADLILHGETSYDIEAIEADRYFDVPGYQERGEINAKCYRMAAEYYGKVERTMNEA